MFDRSSPVPLHAQLYDYLAKKIREGEYEQHQLIPSENELSQMCGISRTTVRGVILRLSNEKMLYRVPGKGTFVSGDKITARSVSQKGIREQLEEMGYDTDTITLKKGIVNADRKVAKNLNIKKGDPVAEIVRIRSADKTPFSYHTSYLPIGRFPDILEKDIEAKPICDILEHDYFAKAKYGEETLESVVASSAEADGLNVPVGFHVLLAECTLYDQNDDPFEFSKEIFRGDRIKLEFQFDRV